MSRSTVPDLSLLDEDQRRVLAAWRADLAAISVEAPRESGIPHLCAELGTLFARALCVTAAPDDALWSRIYGLSARVTRAAAGWATISAITSAALRRLRRFVEENRDLGAVVDESPVPPLAS